MEEANAQGKDLSLVIAGIHTQSQRVFPIGNMSPKQGRIINEYTLDPKVGHYGFLIGLLARNGGVTELLKLHWNNKWWDIAYKITNQSGNVLKEQIAKDFPKTELWN